MWGSRIQLYSFSVRKCNKVMEFCNKKTSLHYNIAVSYCLIFLMQCQILRNRLFLPFILRAHISSQAPPLITNKVAALPPADGLLGENSVPSVVISAAVCKTFQGQRCHFRCACTCLWHWALFVYSSCDRYCSPYASLHKANSSCVGLTVFEAQEEASRHAGTVCCDHHRWLSRRSLTGVVRNGRKWSMISLLSTARKQLEQVNTWKRAAVGCH